MTLPVDELLKMITKYNAGRAVAKEGVERVIKETIPQVAKEATEGVKFVKSLPVESFSQDTMAQLRRVQSGADASKLLKQHMDRSYANISPDVQQTPERITELKETYGYNPATLEYLSKNPDAGERVTTAGLDLANQAIEDTRHWAREMLNGTPGAQDEMLRAYDTAGEFMRQAAGLGQGKPFRLLKAGPQGSLEALKDAASKDSLLAAKMKTTSSLTDFARIINSADNKTLMKMSNQMGEASWNGALRELYYNSMLSRVKTQGKNIVGNALNVAVNVGERYINAAVSTAFGSKTVTFDDANNLVKGYWHGFREALGKAAPAYHGEVDARWAGKNVIDEPGGSDLELMLGSQFGKTGAYIGKHLQAPTKTLQASDTFYKEWTYYAELYAESAKRAASAGENFDEVFQRMYYDPTTELTEAARARAETQALVFTHTEDLWNKWDGTSGTQAFQGIGRVADALNKVKQGGGPGGWIMTLTMPFVKTSANALRFNMERFPGLNLLDNNFRADFFGRNGTAARDLAISKSLMGGSVMATFAIAAANGEITGAAPRDPELRASFIAAHPEYSVNFAGTWVSYDPQSTLGILLAYAANTGAALGAKTGIEYESMAEKFIWAGSLAFSKINDTVPMLEPVGTLMDMMGAGDFPSDSNLTDRFLRGLFKYANQAVPGFLQDVTQHLDPIQKDLKDANDYLLQYVPGHGEEPNLDAFGRKRYLGYGFSNDIVPNTVRFLSGFNVRPENLSVVDQELIRLGVGVKERTKVRGVPLTAAQRRRMQEVAGPRAYEAVEEFIGSTMYKEINDHGREQIIKRLITQAYDMGSATLQMEDFSLREEIMKTALEERNIKP